MKRLVILLCIGLFGALPVLAQSEEAQALYQQGVDAYWSNNNIGASIPFFDAAIALEPDYAEAYAYRGSSYRAQGEMERAKADFDHAIEIDPENPVALAMLARWYVDRGELLTAQDLLNQALDQDPELGLIYYNFARLQMKRGSIAAGFLAYDEAIKREQNQAALANYY